MVLCIKDYASGSASNDDWTVIQSNIVGAVTGPDTVIAGHVATFNGTSGRIIQDSGFSIASSVPANARFTDTTYAAATTSADGLMTASDKAKLNGIAAGADVTNAAAVKAAGAFMKATGYGGRYIGRHHEGCHDDGRAHQAFRPCGRGRGESERFQQR